MRTNKQHGFSLLGILISLACVVVLMSIYMTSVDKAVTGGKGNSVQESVWGMQDQIHLHLIGQGLTIHAMTNADNFLTPSTLSKSDDVTKNTSANFWSALLSQNIVGAKQLVSPTDRGWVEEAPYSTSRGHFNPNFSVDLNETSNVSYAHMPLYGERLKKRWNPRSGNFPIIGNRGPQDGVENSTSFTLDDDGIWRGWILNADSSTDWVEGTSKKPKWRRGDDASIDNIFLLEGDSKDDAILGLTLEMYDDGPVLVWD
jgi:type II secretory pathway pseudopilin PulG